MPGRQRYTLHGWLLRPLAVTLLLQGSTTACILFGRDSSDSVKSKMVGMPKERVIECMGTPDAKSTRKNDEVWTYHFSGESSGSGKTTKVSGVSAFGEAKGTKQRCDVVFKDNKVKKLSSGGHAAGSGGDEDQCAFLVKNCGR